MIAILDFDLKTTATDRYRAIIDFTSARAPSASFSHCGNCAVGEAQVDVESPLP